jgi:hypothetical protein
LIVIVDPFNGSTRLSYVIPYAMSVALRVYDSAGKRVKTLAQATKEAGSSSATLDASMLASGVYFASFVSAADQKFLSAQTKKMILIR